tara:strand:+ start:28400 stop:29089 length:690 start_codon:yes stop_codon:yes gene_type:complete
MGLLNSHECHGHEFLSDFLVKLKNYRDSAGICIALFWGLKMGKSNKTYSLNKNKYLLPPELDRLDYIINSFMDKNLRDILLLKLALDTGARAQELLNIQFKDINEYDETIYINGLKNSNDRELPVRKDVFRRIVRLKPIAAKEKGNNGLIGEDRYLFPITYPRLVQIWLFYRPVHKKFHSLRHTFAIELYKKTKDIRLLQMALGHRNIANTMIYADYVYTQTELKRLIL